MHRRVVRTYEGREQKCDVMFNSSTSWSPSDLLMIMLLLLQHELLRSPNVLMYYTCVLSLRAHTLMKPVVSCSYCLLSVIELPGPPRRSSRIIELPRFCCDQRSPKRWLYYISELSLIQWFHPVASHLRARVRNQISIILIYVSVNTSPGYNFCKS